MRENRERRERRVSERELRVRERERVDLNVILPRFHGRGMVPTSKVFHKGLSSRLFFASHYSRSLPFQWTFFPFFPFPQLMPLFCNKQQRRLIMSSHALFCWSNFYASFPLLSLKLA